MVDVDTSVLLRVANPDDARHGQAVSTLARLRAEGARLVLVPQALAEFWVVATRPVAVNGLGASSEAANVKMERLLGFFRLLPEPVGAFETWLRVVSGSSVAAPTTLVSPLPTQRRVATVFSRSTREILRAFSLCLASLWSHSSLEDVAGAWQRPILCHDPTKQT